MVEFSSQDLILVTEFYEIEPRSVSMLKHSAWGTVFMLEASDGSYIGRVVDPSALGNTENGAMVASALRESGFGVAPNYISNRATKRYTLILDDQRALTIYEYIPGFVTQDLSRELLARSVDAVQLLLKHMAKVSREVMPVRSVADQFRADLLDAEHILMRAGAPTFLRILKDLDVRLIDRLDGSLPVHGDLNATNFVWSGSGALNGLIDFGSTGHGSVLADVLPFITGTGIRENAFQLDRFGDCARVLRCVRGYCEISGQECVDLLTLVALGFFGRVNSSQPPTADLVWRDALRAQVLVANRAAIAGICEELLQG